MIQELKNKQLLVVDINDSSRDSFIAKLQSIGFEKIDSCSSLKQCNEYLNNNLPDIIFLDHLLEDGHISTDIFNSSLDLEGISFFITSAIYSSEVFNQLPHEKIVDFISKDISSFDLEKTIIMKSQEKEVVRSSQVLKTFIVLKSGNTHHVVLLKDIKYISVVDKYVRVHCGAQKYLIRSSLNSFTDTLPDYFVKIHQTYAINLYYLTKISVNENVLYLDDLELPFSRGQRKNIIDYCHAL